MNAAQLTSIRELRHEGYAVIVWTPEELGNASTKDVENRSIELGFEIIETLTNWEDEA